MSNYFMTIGGKRYESIDSLNNITLADSFLRNKIGTGHGEAKLYVGNESERLADFFGNLNDFNVTCFFLKKDFDKFLQDAKDEYKNPQQEYSNKDKLPKIYDELSEEIFEFDDKPLFFELYRVGVEPPRVYMNSKSEYYSFIRKIGLPNISYLSIMKLKDVSSGKYVFYFKLFIDYKSDIVKYESPAIKSAVAEIEKSNVPEKSKERLIQARIGQGEYRMKVIEDCLFCPFTFVNDEHLLVASHIKPWAKSDDKEKIDPKNGFAFTPTYDKLFDIGYISFNSDKTLIVSPWLSPMNQKRLSIYNGKKIDKLPLDEKREEYLVYHRENVFKN